MNETLLTTLEKYADSKPARFHMPGHKGRLNNAPFHDLARLDVTELTDTDELSSPKGILLDLERKYARIYGARDSFLLVNGSTIGNLALLLSLGNGKRILLARNCHRSVISGIALAGHEAISIFPNDASGIITPEQVRTALSECHADAVFITSPTYRGVCCDIEGIAEAARETGALLFVDCAHGAHFPFSEALPPVPSCADAWVVSCHKTLNALTQTAVLHIGKNCPIASERIRSRLALVQTSSPSYLLMLSLENAITDVGCWNAHCARMHRIRSVISSIPGIWLFEPNAADDTVNCSALPVQTIQNAHDRPNDMRRNIVFDVSRLVFGFNGMTGFALGSFLEKQGIYVEMCDMQSVVLITSPNDPDEWYSRLLDALDNISASVGCLTESAICRANRIENESEQTDNSHCNVHSTSLPAADRDTIHGKPVLSAREAMFGDTESVTPEGSIGRIAARAVGTYPPGIALLFPGELIERAAINTLLKSINSGAGSFGLSNDGSIEVVSQTPCK